MNPNWLGIISAILAFIAFYFFFKFTKSRRKKTRICLTLAVIILAIPGASFSAYYAHLIPTPDWYYQFRSITGTEFLVLFVGAAGGSVASLIPRRMLIIPLFGVAAFSFVPIIKPILGPIPKTELNDLWRDDICIQSTASTCGAASMASISKHLGYETTEGEIAAEAHSYIGGTEAWYLARSARSRGLRVDFDSTYDFTPERGLPAIVGVLLNSSGHFIAILEEVGDEFLVGDPLRGREMLSRERLVKRYQFTGFHMRISAKRDHESSSAF